MLTSDAGVKSLCYDYSFFFSVLFGVSVMFNKPDDFMACESAGLNLVVIQVLTF